MDFNNRLTARDGLSFVEFTYWREGHFLVHVGLSGSSSPEVRSSNREKQEFAFRRIYNPGINEEDWFVVDTVATREMFFEMTESFWKR
jgi:hypothetical protein